uniref:Uncharacterized protein n=1 Tax=Theropithecus gelada TaxID=9565 RepID=A0A8D2F0J1_THEGE
MAKHLKFIARTVMVWERNMEGAYRTLSRILTMDRLIEGTKPRQYYEKPCRRQQGKATKELGQNTADLAKSPLTLHPILNWEGKSLSF